jgi:hypothetical protein
MKKIFLSLFLVPVISIAQPVRVNKTVFCDDLDKLIPFIQDKRREVVDWLGINSKETSYVLTVNKDTQTWTFLQINIKENIACVVGSGEGYHKEVDKTLKTPGLSKTF